MTDELPHKSLNLVPREELTERQVKVLLGIVGTIMPMVMKEVVRNSDGAAVSADGGVQSSADVAMMAALDRIETLVKDDSRWNLNSRNLLETALVGMIHENTAFFTAQKDAAKLVQLPSFQHRPALYRIPNGWAAVMGDPADKENSIIGIGPSPDAALKDFDVVFMAKRVTVEDNDTKEVDPSGGPSGKGTARSGKKSRRDRKAPEHDRPAGK